MRYKSDVCLDILAVLAYGPQPVINSAGQVLLHYYPLKDVGKCNSQLKLLLCNYILQCKYSVRKCGNY